MFIEAILAGIILGRLRSGKVSALENLKFKGWKPLVALFALDLVMRLFIVNSYSDFAQNLFIYYPIFSILFYIFTIIILGFNQNLKYMRVLQAGYVLNLLPMATNSGKMPVLESALASLGKFQEIEILKRNLLLTHSLIDEATRFKILSDRIPISIFIPKVISFGDIVIGVGLMLFISHYMTIGRKITC